MWISVCSRLLLALALALAWQPVMAQTAAPPAATPMDEFFKLPQFGGAALNPGKNGNTHLAFLREIKGRTNLVVMDLATKALTNVAGYDAADVIDFRWINSERLFYRVADLRVGVGDSSKYGVFAINRDGSMSYTLSEGLASFTGTVGSGTRGLPARADFHSRVRSGDPNDFIAVQVATSPFRTSLVRVNSRNGTRTAIEAAGVNNVVEWALDANDVARAVLTLDKTVYALHVRSGPGEPWRKVHEADLTAGDGFSPLTFDRNGTLYLAGRTRDRDTKAIYRFDWAKGAPEPEPVISLKNYDIEGGLIFDRTDGATLQGVHYEADQPGTHWLDPGWKALQDTVDASLKGRANRLAGDLQGFVLVQSVSDTSPGRSYLLDTKAKRLQLLGTRMPGIDEKLQASSEVIRYAARDGLVIPALLTLPRGAAPKALPLVVLAHGGPWVRGLSWAWERDRQFLASRGYAVLEPDFRGSTGHGWKLFRAGWKQWGLAMQDDLADGVADLAKKGIVDPARVCIAGASYGGYAVVMGLIRHPEVYKCGISWVGVTDIDLLYSVGWGDTAGSDAAKFGMPILAADPDKDREQIKATSAIEQAARLKAPLIIAYGREDVRVPFEHGTRLRDALKPHNSQVQYIEYPGEGHGWRLLETNRDFWTRAEKLLRDTIGPR